MEHIKEIKIKIEKSTNKHVTVEILRPFEDESIEEYIERVNEILREILIDL